MTFASLAFQNAPSEDSDQTVWMRRLIWWSESSLGAYFRRYVSIHCSIIYAFPRPFCRTVTLYSYWFIHIKELPIAYMSLTIHGLVLAPTSKFSRYISTLKMPRKPASENVCLCRLLNILVNFSNLFLHTGKQCGAVWPWSTLFAKMTFKITSRWQSRQQLVWLADLGLRGLVTLGGFLRCFTRETYFVISSCFYALHYFLKRYPIGEEQCLSSRVDPFPEKLQKQFWQISFLWTYTHSPKGTG